MKRFFKSSLRQKILLPTIVIMICCIAGLSLTVVSVQKHQLEKLGESVMAGLETTNSAASENYAKLGKDVSNYLQQMNDTMNASIKETTRRSLEEEKTELEAQFDTNLHPKCRIDRRPARAGCPSGNFCKQLFGFDLVCKVGNQ